MVPFEAFPLREPVLTTTDAGGPLEVVSDRRTGLVVSPAADEARAGCRVAAGPSRRGRVLRPGGKGDRGGGHVESSRGEAARVKVAYFSPMPPERTGDRGLLGAARERPRPTGGAGRPAPGSQAGASWRRPLSLSRREQPGRARLDRGRAAPPSRCRRPPRLRAAPPRRRYDCRPRRRTRLPRRDGARTRRRRPAARARSPRQADPAPVGVAAGGSSRSRRSFSSTQPGSSSTRTPLPALARAAGYDRRIWVVPHPAWPVPSQPRGGAPLGTASWSVASAS